MHPKSVVALELLELFQEIQRHGTISAAARHLDMSPSLATRKLASLERALQTPLFLRTTRKMRLTEGGAVLLAWAQATLEGYAQVSENLEGLKGELAGPIRIAMSDHATAVFLAPFLQEFVPRFPKIQFRVSTTDSLVDLVEKGYDLALHTGLVPDSGLIAVPIQAVRRVVCAAPDYLARRGTPRTPADLLQHDCLTHAPTEPGNWFFRRGHGDPVRQPVSALISVDSYISLAELARRGLGIVRISRNAVREDLRAGRLVQVLPDYECAHQAGDAPGVWLLYPDRRLLRRTRVFVEEFSAYMKRALA